jgi:hypothetical protein
MKPHTNHGWVKMRRGILDHVSSGRLNLREYAVFTLLIIMADSSSGSGIVNSPVLQYWFPELNSDGAQRALASLEREGFIYRDNPQGNRRAYHYWVNKFEATTGPNRLRLSNLSKVFETKDITDIIWEVLATDPATVGATDPATDPANSNKKSINKEIKKARTEKTTPVSSSMCDSLCDSNSDFSKEDARKGNPQCVTDDVTHSVTSMCDPKSDKVPINGAAGLAEMFAPKTAPKPKSKPVELTQE